MLQIHKKNDTSHINYRPISLLSTVGKVLETKSPTNMHLIVLETTVFLLPCNLALCLEIVPLTNWLTLTTHSAKLLMKTKNSLMYSMTSAKVLTDLDKYLR